MLDNIPEAREFAEVLPEQLVNVGSAKILPNHWLQLARRINDIFALVQERPGSPSPTAPPPWKKRGTS